jgi:DnaJ-class molecular chaperone
MNLQSDDIATTLRLQKERATTYCQTCGGSGYVRVCVTGTCLDFETCPKCHGTGKPKVFKNRKNREIFEV